MIDLKELLIQLVGDSTAEGDRHACALIHPYGIEATSAVMLLLLQTKPNRTSLENELLKGLAHHPINDVSGIHDKAASVAWLQSIRAIVYTPETVPSSGKSGYVKTAADVPHRLKRIQQACQSARVLLHIEARSDIEQMALVRCIYILGQVQFIELEGRARFSALRSLPDLVEALKWCVHFRDAIRHPDPAQTMEDWIKKLLDDCDLEKINTIEKVCVTALDNTNLDGVADVPLAIQLSHADAKKQYGYVIELDFDVMLACHAMAALHEAIAEMKQQAESQESFSVARAVGYWFIYLTVTENPILFDVNFMEKYHGLFRAVTYDNRMRTWIGHVLRYHSQLTPAFVLTFLQKQTMLGLSSEYLPVIVDLMDILVDKIRESHAQSIVIQSLCALMTALVQQIGEQKPFIKSDAYATIWKKITYIARGNLSSLEALHHAFLPIILRQWSLGKPRENEANALLFFIGTLPGYLSEEMIRQLLEMSFACMESQSWSVEHRHGFIAHALIGVSQLKFSTGDPTNDLQGNDVPMGFVQWFTSPPHNLQWLLSKPETIAYLQLFDDGNIALLQHPFMQFMNNLSNMIASLWQPQCLGLSIDAHKKAVHGLAQLRETAHKKIRLWQTHLIQGKALQQMLILLVRQCNFDGLATLFSGYRLDNTPHRQSLLQFYADYHKEKITFTEGVTAPSSWKSLMYFLENLQKASENQSDQTSDPNGAWIKILCALKTELNQFFNNLLTEQIKVREPVVKAISASQVSSVAPAASPRKVAAVTGNAVEQPQRESMKARSRDQMSVVLYEVLLVKGSSITVAPEKIDFIDLVKNGFITLLSDALFRRYHKFIVSMQYRFESTGELMKPFVVCWVLHHVLHRKDEQLQSANEWSHLVRVIAFDIKDTDIACECINEFLQSLPKGSEQYQQFLVAMFDKLVCIGQPAEELRYHMPNPRLFAMFISSERAKSFLTEAGSVGKALEEKPIAAWYRTYCYFIDTFRKHPDHVLTRQSLDDINGIRHNLKEYFKLLRAYVMEGDIQLMLRAAEKDSAWDAFYTILSVLSEDVAGRKCLRNLINAGKRQMPIRNSYWQQFSRVLMSMKASDKKVAKKLEPSLASFKGDCDKIYDKGIQASAALQSSRRATASAAHIGQTSGLHHSAASAAADTSKDSAAAAASAAPCSHQSSPVLSGSTSSF